MKEKSNKNKISENQKKNNASIDRLEEISSWVASVHDLERLLDLIIETAIRVMDARAGSLLLLDRKTNNLYFRHPEMVKELKSRLAQYKQSGRSAPPRN